MDQNQAEALDRRALLQRMALLLGATAIPAEAFAAAKSRARKRFLVPAQYALVSAVAETIVPATDTPGAIGAGVPAKLDAMLGNWASASTRKQVTDALARIDAAAMTAQKKSFVALTPALREKVLLSHDAAALKNVPAPNNAPKMSFFSPVPYVADPGYLKLKELVIALYYNSEIAMTKELVYEHNPGTWQPSIKITENSRPWASTGPF